MSVALKRSSLKQLYTEEEENVRAGREKAHKFLGFSQGLTLCVYARQNKDLRPRRRLAHNSANEWEAQEQKNSDSLGSIQKIRSFR